MRTCTYLGSAWHGWFHIVGNTYGTWLYGDERGFRTRHHREHIEGDYRNPPPTGVYDALRACSERAMKRAAVVLSEQARALACRAMAQSLRYHEVELIDLAVTSQHYHFLARFGCTEQWLALVNGAGMMGGDAHRFESVGFSRFDRSRRRSALDDPPRHYTGLAKKDVARALSDAKLVEAGGVFAKRCKPLPITCREHQLNVVRYIRDHVHEGAAVLSMLEGRK